MIERVSGYPTNPTSASIVVPSRGDLAHRCHARSIYMSRPSGKPYFSSRMAASFRPSVGFGVREKSLRILSVETGHKAPTRRPAWFAAATIAHITAARAVRDFAITTTLVNLIGRSRKMLSRVSCLAANNAVPIPSVFTISLNPELRNWFGRFARRANLQGWNRQDSLILSSSTHEEVQFV
jgi:hypothetical protein